MNVGKLPVRSYAIPPGLAGRTVRLVEVSTDGSETWATARLSAAANAYCWRLWTADVEIRPRTSEMIVRAVDSSGKLQPETVAWNLKGYQFTAWHKSQIDVR